MTFLARYLERFSWYLSHIATRIDPETVDKEMTRCYDKYTVKYQEEIRRHG